MILFRFKRLLAYFMPFLQRGNPWEKDSVVKEYNAYSHLYKPEQTILSMLKHTASNMKMLDIGVGAGRTTAHFAPLMQEYVGIDFSTNMIEACKKRFEKNKNYTFKVADARNLNLFSEGQFDFVLFSFNGLDYLNHIERLKTLQEIHRILKSNSYFCFSAHNLNYAWKICVIERSNLFPSIHEVRRILLMRLYNWSCWKILRKRNKNCGHMLINDGIHNFAIKSYYITPTEQIKQLINAKFKEIKVYSLSGKELKSSELQKEDDLWLYYLCKK